MRAVRYEGTIVLTGNAMTEDEACELLVTQRAYWMYGVGWRIILERTPYGDNVRIATPEESLVLEKVMATVSGPKDTDQVVASDTTWYEGWYEGLFTES